MYVRFKREWKGNAVGDTVDLPETVAKGLIEEQFADDMRKELNVEAGSGDPALRAAGIKMLETRKQALLKQIEIIDLEIAKRRGLDGKKNLKGPPLDKMIKEPKVSKTAEMAV